MDKLEVRLEEQTSRNPMTYKMDKCKVLLLGINTCNGTGWEILSGEQDLTATLLYLRGGYTEG